MGRKGAIGEMLSNLVFKVRMRYLDLRFGSRFDRWEQMKPSEYYDWKTHKRYPDETIAEIRRKKREELEQLVDELDRQKPKLRE